jgi:hypothetical protein
MARPTFGPKEMHKFNCMRCGDPYELPGEVNYTKYCRRCIEERDILQARLDKLTKMLKKSPNDQKILKEIEKVKALMQRR